MFWVFVGVVKLHNLHPLCFRVIDVSAQFFILIFSLASWGLPCICIALCFGLRLCSNTSTPKGLYPLLTHLCAVEEHIQCPVSSDVCFGFYFLWDSLGFPCLCVVFCSAKTYPVFLWLSHRIPENFWQVHY